MMMISQNLKLVTLSFPPASCFLWAVNLHGKGFFLFWTEVQLKYFPLSGGWLQYDGVANNLLWAAASATTATLSGPLLRLLLGHRREKAALMQMQSLSVGQLLEPSGELLS